MSVSVEDLLRIEMVEALNVTSLLGKTCRGVSSDSRTIGRGEAFFALRGATFDGRRFVKQAFQQGALCAVVERGADVREVLQYPLLVVDDTTRALGALAKIHRKKFDIPVIAVAGSNGKTTTKEMLARVLGTKYSVLSTEGNLNNQIGVPQTMFRLEKSHEIAVVEIGTNHFGELHTLCDILEPTHGIITNVGREHMEFFKTLNGVAKAEGELFTAIKRSGLGYVNADDPFVLRQAKKLRNKISYGFSRRNVHVYGSMLKMNAKGCAEFSVRKKGYKPFTVRLSVPGKHAMINSLAAATVALSHGVPAADIQRALKEFRAVQKRMETVEVDGVIILNDTYNANPDSVTSALAVLQSMKCSGKKIAVLGDMLELGRTSRREHQLIGKVAGRTGVGCLLTFGVMARYIHESARVPLKYHFHQKSELSKQLLKLAVPGDIVLVKGSRGMKMEEIVKSILEERDHGTA